MSHLESSVSKKGRVTMLYEFLQVFEQTNYMQVIISMLHMQQNINCISLKFWLQDSDIKQKTQTTVLEASIFYRCKTMLLKWELYKVLTLLTIYFSSEWKGKNLATLSHQRLMLQLDYFLSNWISWHKNCQETIWNIKVTIAYGNWKLKTQ